MKLQNWIMVCALVPLAACGGEEGERVELGEPAEQQEMGRASWSPELTAAVDSANAAYADGNYEEAREIFQSLTEENPELGVAYFGLYMAERALGNSEAAMAALEEAEKYNPGLGVMHEAATDTSLQMPPGHPGMGMPQGHPPVEGEDGEAGGEQQMPPQPMGSGGR